MLKLQCCRIYKLWQSLILRWIGTFISSEIIYIFSFICWNMEIYIYVPDFLEGIEWLSVKISPQYLYHRIHTSVMFVVRISYDPKWKQIIHVKNNFLMLIFLFLHVIHSLKCKMNGSQKLYISFCTEIYSMLFYAFPREWILLKSAGLTSQLCSSEYSPELLIADFFSHLISMQIIV